MPFIQMNDDIAARVERMAAAAFSLDEIADVLQVDLDELKAEMAIKESAFYKAHRKGFLGRQLELRERVFRDARNGSSPAQSIAYKLLNDAELKDRL